MFASKQEVMRRIGHRTIALRRSHARCLAVTLVVFFSYCLPVPSTSANGIDINNLLGQVREQIRALQTVEYEAAVRVLRVDADGVVSRLRYEVEFRSDGARYYSRFRLKGDQGERVDQTVAFDGNKFERLDEDLGVLHFTASPPASLPYQFPQPFIYVYGFAIGSGEQLDLAALNDADAWRRFQLTVTSAERVFDTQGVKVKRLRFSSPDGRGTVDFSIENGLLPVRVRSESEVLKSELEIRKSMKFESGKQALFFPIQIIDRAYDGTGNLRFEFQATIEPTTLKVNQIIDETRFTIDRKRARWLDDVDGRLAGTAQVLEINPVSPYRLRAFAVISGVFLCCAGVYMFLSISRRRGKAQGSSP